MSPSTCLVRNIRKFSVAERPDENPILARSGIQEEFGAASAEAIRRGGRRWCSKIIYGGALRLSTLAERGHSRTDEVP